VIQPNSREKVQISLRTEIITKVHIALYIKVEGQQSPFMLTITADSRGPTVEADQVEIDWQNVPVLRDITRTLRITNKSKIQAEYTAFTKLKESIWKVIQRYGKLEPNEEREIEIVCNADEVIKFQDTLHIIINNGQDLEVALRARGVGSTLFCKDWKTTGLQMCEADINFTTKYTHQNCTEEFFLENRGRRQMTIEWARTTKMTRKDKKPAADNK
jgi:hydrocephalus-inducing protein